MPIEIPEIERIVFFPGQRLTAGDMTDLETTNKELRWLHNRTLHPWGIAAGLDVLGEAGGTSVTVQPGYAVDAEGRELILNEATAMPIPAIPGAATGGPATFYLVANYVADQRQSVLETRAGVCRTGGTVRLSDTPALAWRTAAALNEHVDVILASIQVRNCVLAARPSAAPRRLVRPTQQAYVAGGQTTKGKTSWQPLTVGAITLGQQVTVDTSAAGFKNAPRYLVDVRGDRVRQSPLLLALGVTEITGAGVNGFTLRVLFPALAGPSAFNPAELRDPVQGPATLNALGWCVSWLGIEG